MVKKKYSIKEIFYSLQGEGANAGKAAIFCRFSGCNLWSGIEKDRKNAICQFCDTDFVGTDGEGGGKFSSASQLVKMLASFWPSTDEGLKFVIFTGGEPALQLDRELIKECKNSGFIVAVETNGTLDLPEGIDWVCVSPKMGSELKIKKGNELKVVYPQIGLNLESLQELEFDNFFLQAKEEKGIERNIKDTIQTCLDNPKWRMSIQTHKILGVR